MKESDIPAKKFKSKEMQQMKIDDWGRGGKNKETLMLSRASDI